jgi:hypothetical protein
MCMGAACSWVRQLLHCTKAAGWFREIEVLCATWIVQPLAADICLLCLLVHAGHLVTLPKESVYPCHGMPVSGCVSSFDTLQLLSVNTLVFCWTLEQLVHISTSAWNRSWWMVLCTVWQHVGCLLECQACWVQVAVPPCSVLCCMVWLQAAVCVRCRSQVCMCWCM